jgi:SWIM zinc finger
MKNGPAALAQPRTRTTREDLMANTSLAQPAHDSRHQRLTREARGIALFEERGHEIQQLGRGVYGVPSCTGRGDYLVRYSDEAESCECGDNQHRGYVCKHLYAAALFAAKRRKAVRVNYAPVLADDEL